VEADLRGYEPVQQWFRENKPDVLVYIYNDHMTSFFDHYSHFALGVGERFEAPTKAAGRVISRRSWAIRSSPSMSPR
jgi:hypothetical protein